MNKGYVKLWRKTLDSTVMQNSDLFMFWCWCLMKATHKPKTVMIGYQEIELLPGQFVFGREKCSHELPLSIRTIRTCLEKLRRSQNLVLKTTNKFSIVSIVNWEVYQAEADENDQQNDQQTTSKRPANDHKQEVKECKAQREGSKKPPPPPFAPPAWIDIETWNSFVAHRKEVKSPMTQRAMALLVKELERLQQQGHNHAEVLNQSILRGWKSVYAIKEDSNNGRGPGRKLQGVVSEATERSLQNAKRVLERLQERERDEKPTTIS